MSVSFFLNLAVNVDFKLQINNLSGTVHSEESKWTTMEMMSFDPEYFFLGGGGGRGGGGKLVSPVHTGKVDFPSWLPN